MKITTETTVITHRMLDFQERFALNQFVRKLGWKFCIQTPPQIIAAAAYCDTGIPVTHNNVMYSINSVFPKQRVQLPVQRYPHPPMPVTPRRRGSPPSSKNKQQTWTLKYKKSAISGNADCMVSVIGSIRNLEKKVKEINNKLNQLL